MYMSIFVQESGSCLPFFPAAIGLLFVSSTVSLAVPFGIGKVIDIIYTQDRENMTQRLNSFCTFLFGVFLVGALANMGRVYLMNTSGMPNK